MCTPHKNGNVNSIRYSPLYKLRNGDVLLLNSGNLVLLDVVVNGGDNQSSAVSDDTNDLIPPGPRTCTIHFADDDNCLPPTIGLKANSASTGSYRKCQWTD